MAMTLAKVGGLGLLIMLLVSLGLGFALPVAIAQGGLQEDNQGTTNAIIAERMFWICQGLYDRINNMIVQYNISLPQGLAEKLNNASRTLEMIQAFLYSSNYTAAMREALKLMNSLNPVFHYVMAKIRINEDVREEIVVNATVRLQRSFLERLEKIVNASEELNVTIPLEIKMKIEKLKEALINLSLKPPKVNISHIKEVIKEAREVIRDFMKNMNRSIREVIEAKVMAIVMPRWLGEPLQWFNGTSLVSWILEERGIEMAISKINASIERLKDIRERLEKFTNASEKAIIAIDRAIEAMNKTIERLQTIKSFEGNMDEFKEKIREMIAEHANESMGIISQIANHSKCKKILEELENFGHKLSDLTRGLREKLREKIRERMQEIQQLQEQIREQIMEQIRKWGERP